MGSVLGLPAGTKSEAVKWRNDPNQALSIKSPCLLGALRVYRIGKLGDM